MTEAEGTNNQTGANGGEPAKAKFARALDEAKAGVQQLGREAQEKANAYREKATATGSEMAGEAKVKGQQAKDRAFEMANEGKAKASTAISGLSKMVNENAPTIDEKVGPKYGDYARSAAKSIQDAADWVEHKDLVELGEDAKEFVRKSPGLAVGLAAVAGFMLARLFRGGSSD
jgi:ElaB/YqjD/DUF883 family membrane-anchored ribosome-binding protein